MLTNIKTDKKLGYTYYKDYTIFRVWAPLRETVDLAIYDDYRHIRRKVYKMSKDSFGVFETTVQGDLNLKYYSYILNDKYEVTDPYSKASSINSYKSCVVDLNKTDPDGFKEHNIPFNNKDEAIIYEVHIKDYSSLSSSNTKEEYKGKFLGLSDKNSNYNGYKTGIENLKELGITYLHLMPIFDFLTVDEDPSKFFNDDNYNWGYDPELYNNIEGSYSTDPYNPISRIYEFKKMIMTLHENGISVIMDVVYNHTYKSQDSNFNELFPDYYYRIDSKGNFSNGSGCGNEFMSDAAMGRKFIVDSLKYYVKEYKIDGFRFDLMALMDLETVNSIIKELKEINPNILIYGEPWMALDSPLPLNERVLPGTQKDKGFSVFNSEFRDAIKGDNDGGGKGYIQGDYYLKNSIESGISGSIDFDDYRKGITYKACESINYFNSHDNLILMDKLEISISNKDDLVDIYKMAFNILFTSLGIPFIHAGNEFMRNKKNCHNSYNKPLSINGIDWQLKEKNYDVFNYICQLINFRKKRKEFTLVNPEEIRKKFFFIAFLEDNTIAYTIKNEKEKILLVIHNSFHDKRTLRKKRLLEHLKHCYDVEEIKEIYELFNYLGEVYEKVEKEDFVVNRYNTEIYELIV